MVHPLSLAKQSESIARDLGGHLSMPGEEDKAMGRNRVRYNRKQ